MLTRMSAFLGGVFAVLVVQCCLVLLHSSFLEDTLGLAILGGKSIKTKKSAVESSTKINMASPPPSICSFP